VDCDDTSFTGGAYVQARSRSSQMPSVHILELLWPHLPERKVLSIQPIVSVTLHHKKKVLETRDIQPEKTQHVTQTLENSARERGDLLCLTAKEVEPGQRRSRGQVEPTTISVCPDSLVFSPKIPLPSPGNPSVLGRPNGLVTNLGNLRFTQACYGLNMNCPYRLMC
jgi:hypothetical protein